MGGGGVVGVVAVAFFVGEEGKLCRLSSLFTGMVCSGMKSLAPGIYSQTILVCITYVEYSVQYVRTTTLSVWK